MSSTRRASTIRRWTSGALLALCVGLAIERAGAQQQGSAGANVNVVSGTGADGDWTLQRQNEPSLACSSRNPLNCLAGANDYRTVDIPFPTSGEKVTGDAWLGWYTTKNGGLTWRTRLLPGYPQDASAVGLASPLKGYAAGADPVIRPGTNGLFYYGGLVFNREEGGGSAIFVARFIDNNNQEGTAGEPIDYLGASIVHRIGAAPTVVARGQGRGQRPAAATAARRSPTPANTRAARVRAGVEQPGALTQLVDKPWMAVDVPRAGAQTCSIGGPGTGVPLQTFPGGRVYMAYALFDDPGEQRGRIMFSSSANCGVTWSAPRVLSRVPSADVNDDGVANTTDVDLTRAALGRVCGQSAFPSNADYNNDCKIDIVDLTLIGRAVGLPVPTQPRLSQGATIAINPQTGAVQVAWRQFDDGVLGDGIVTVRSTNGGGTFSAPRVVANFSPFEQGTTDTSFRTNAFPTMAMDGTGRAYLAWSARGYATNRSSPIDGDGRVVLSTSADGITWSAPRPVDNEQNPGHQIMPALAFAQGKLQLIYYDLREDVSQLFGPYVDEFPILAGPPPRLRHTVDVWGAQADPGESPAFTAFRISQYRSGSVPGSLEVQQLDFNPPNLPIFRAGTSPFMGDYLDVATETPFVRNGSAWSFNTAATASPVFHGVWTDNRDIRPPANGLWTDYTPPNPPFPRPTMSGFDPTQSIPPCVPGQAGMRNQNIYTARITRGLVVGAVGNSRRLGSIQRSFPVYAQNNSTTIRSYRLTITNQPVGGQASFKQFEQLTTLDVEVPRRSTVARTVFARSSDPFAQINVSVTEISAPGGEPVTGGQQGTIVLNPDPTNPDLENPDLENPDLENPDLENAEVHNPDLENATTRNPDLENPDLENPDLENPDLENTRVANPSIINPDLENPDLENPDLENPDLENPDLENPDLENGALSDTTWTVTNKGNTASAYTVRLALNRQLPEGFRGQLIAHKIYQTPAALGCSLLKQSQTVLLANIPTARFVAPGELANPDLENPDLENLTVVIAPGETVRITLRVYDPVKADAITFRAAESVTPVAVAQAVNTPEAEAGVTQPAAAGVLTSSAPVPGGTSGGDYTTTLSSILPGTWTVAGGTVPPGLTVDSATGAITGTPTTPGTYTFTARFQSTAGIIDYRTVTITVGAVGADANVGVTAVGPIAPVAIGSTFAYTLTVSNAGPSAASNVRLTDTLPEGTQFVSATTSAGTCQHANGTLLCNLGTLVSGGAATVVLSVRPTIGGSHTNSVVVSTDQADPVAANNTALHTVSASAVVVTPCAAVSFSGPASFIAGPHDLEFGAEKGDFNGDGFSDLVYGPVGVNTVGIVLGNGTGGFNTPTLMTIPGSPDAAAIADLNGDGDLDIVLTSQSVAEAWLLLGNGLGGFAAPATIALPAAPENVVAADFNRDGNMDLALAGNSSGALVIVLHGNGNGTFQPPTTIGATTTLSSVVTDDVNNDTNPDLVLHQEGVGLVVILGSGASGFQPATTIPVTDVSGLIRTGDLTGDGLADLIVGTVPATGAELHVYVGDGAGGFAPSVLIGDPLLTDGGPAVGDFDNDGDLDVAWARSGGGVGIQLNNGSGTFAAPFYLAGPQTSQPIIADLNGDGRADLTLAVGRAFQSQFLVFLNTCDQPPADLAVTLLGPTDPVIEGTAFTYNIQVTNNGPDPATGVQLDFTFDANAAFVAIGGSPGTCSVVRNRVTCQLGTLASGAVSAFAIDLQPRSGGTLSSTAGVTGTTSDPNSANNAAFAETTVTPGASTLVVTNTNDSGPGSLSQAILDANDPGPRDTITFNIPGAGPHTITPTTRSLPGIDQSVVIDGTTQPGYAGTPLIEINGANAGATAGLLVNTSNSIIRGLAINRFQHAGIVLGGAGGHTVEANFIGTTASGTAALGNLQQGLFITSPNNVIGGATAAARNVISGNTAQGVIILGAAATGNVVSGNFIGSNLSGTARVPNGGAGVAVINGASNNTIGGTAAGTGNLISGNAGPGVTINTAGTTGNTVAGNLIGTNAAGSAALFNGNSGVVLNTGATNNTVGGTTAAARNVISGNNQSGVNVSGTGTSANTVAGNYIGTNAAGTAAVGNGNNGITISTGATTTTIGGTASGAGNVISGNPTSGIAVNNTGTTGTTIVGNSIGTNAAGTAAIGNGHGVNIVGGASNTTVGGTATGARNILSGNSGYGVRIADAGTSGNRVLGNFVGTNAAGTAAIPNGLSGVFTIAGASGNTIGGTQPAEGNVISGNASFGVAFFGAATDGGNTVLNNFIGTNAAGTAAIGNNASGVFVETSNNRIGSLTAAIGNTIAFNGDVGVRVGAGTGNAIVNNRIFSNAGLGIDLAPLGVTPNDAGDADAGPNNLQNFPVLGSARTVGSEVRVQVDLTPPPAGPFRVDFYANTACDASGAGEGATLIGVSTLAATTNPTVTFEAVFPTSLVPAGSYLTATATDSGSNTSEFSICEQVDATAGTADLGITRSDSPDPVTVGQPLTYTFAVTNVGPDAASNVVLTDILPGNVTFVSATTTAGTCSGTSTITCAIGQMAIATTVTIDIVVTPTAAGTLLNTASVTATETDPDATNNSATATTSVQAAGPTSFIVTTTASTGAGSLRQAILDANAQPGPDLITFNLPGAGVRTILTPPLPTITDTVAIDGTTQPDFAGTPIIELTGTDTPPGSNGLVVNAADSVIRGLIVNRWPGSGIVLQGPGGNAVVGNWIGTASNGTTPAGNGNGILIQTSGHLIGGATAAERNVISGNAIGVNIGSTSARGNAVSGNYIGTDFTGTLDVGNTDAGVHAISEANTIGGQATGSGNVISGNDQAGVRLGEGATANAVQGNLIGTNAAGTGGIPNGIGVSLGINSDSGASTNTVGGLVAGAANVIAFNTTIGVLVVGGSSDNAIFGNSIHDNGALGIDLNGDGVTANDAGDEDGGGGNGLQNFPVLTGVVGGVQGTLNSIPSTTFRIEFFGNTACDASGNGEGRLFLGGTSVTTDATGDATIPLLTAAAGQFVTATATDSSNNTSEFSTCVTALGPTAEIAVSVADSPDPVVVGGQLSYTVTVTNNGPSPATNVRLSALWNSPFNVDATGPAGTCELTPLLVCTFGTLQSGANTTLGIVGTPGAIGLLGSTFTIQADEDDPEPGSNAVAVSTSVVGGPSSFVVTNTSDTGAGSLRQAILNANASAGADVISFAIGGAGVQTITLTSSLPTITGPTTIDGRTQQGFAGNPLIELNGNGLSDNGLTVSGANNTIIRGLVINRFTGAGILLTNSSVSAVVQGNFIGTNAAGTAALPNGTGIIVANFANAALLGGTTPGDGNLISGNASHGVFVQPGASSTTIQGNLIGLNQNGTAALPNGGNGILVNWADATIGGTLAGARNYISGNASSGVSLNVEEASSTTIEGNYIGTNLAGTAAVPNLQNGVLISSESSDNTIGGVVAGAANLISGNGLNGVSISGFGTSNNVVRGNLIGTGAGGLGSVPNGGHGISIFNAENSQIGGAAGNTIRFNSGAGVNISTTTATTSSTGHHVSANSISDNGLHGINLGPSGITPNDAGDTDSGANGLQNFPVLTAVATGVQGALNSTLNATFRIEFFGNTVCDASGYGEGATFLGTTTVTTDATGSASIPLFIAAPGQFVTATATDPSNNTSEFSACVLTTEAPEIAVAATDAAAAELGPNTATFVVSRTGPTTADLDVPITVGGTATLGTDYFLTSNEPLATAGGVEIRIPAGQASATITVNPVFDPAVEDLETITFTVGASVATVTIADEPVATITATDANAVELGPNTATVVVTRGGASSYSRLVQITVGGTATLATDYLLTSNEPLATAGGVEIVIPAGQTSATITVTPVADALAEGAETVVLTAEGSTTTVTIIDEPAPLSLVVTNTADSGAGSLRAAIIAANALTGTTDTIRFDIPGPGPHSIALLSALPVINDPVIIDGTTEPDFAGTPIVELNGTAAGGTASGLRIDGGNSTIRGLVINRFGQAGIALSTNNGNVVEGNWIGTDTTGEVAAGNGDGVLILSSGNTIGGTSTAARNVLSGNSVSGVRTGISSASGNVIHGNLIGTNAAGTSAIGNGQAGVIIIGNSNLVGGITPQARNIISGNVDTGVRIGGGGLGNSIQGNYIGTDISGTSAIPNQEGIHVGFTAQSFGSGNTIGGLTAGAGNVVAFNSSTGITIQFGATNAILSNSIHDNGGFGIDLDPAGVTSNDAGDGDAGANNLQNFPVLTAASGGVAGTLNSSPNTLYRIEFFGNTACDASGNGEGQLFLGNTAVTTDATGNATLPFFEAATGQFVTATATDSSNNTSEFSACVLTTETVVIALTATDADAAELGGNTGTIVVTRTGPTNADRDVSVHISGTAFPGSDYDITSPSLITFTAGNAFTLRIPAGQAAAALTITPVFSAVVEGPETVILSTEDSSATVTIADEPAVTLNASDSDAAELGGNTGTVVVTRTGPTTYDRDISVFLSGTAFPGSDYDITSPSLVTFTAGNAFTLRIAAGQTTATVTITPIVSADAEVPETVVLSAEGSSATVTIVDQLAPSTLTVTNTSDSGAGSLRAAILAANASTGTPDTISFAIPGAGPHTIALTTFLPTITDRVIIDGTTQPGYNGTPLIALDGTDAGATANGLFIGTGGSGSTIRALAIGGFGAGGAPGANGGAGIVIQGAGGNFIERNFIGTDAAGLLARPNRADAIFIDNSPNNVIGGVDAAVNGNLLSGNSRFGLMLSGTGTTGTIVRHNRIGTTVTGSQPLGNGDAGVAIVDGSQNTIGSAVDGAGNTIAYNTGAGVHVASGTGNAILLNNIFANGSLGINLGADTVAPNDAGDGDTGPNNLQNFPVLTADPSGVQIALNGAPDTTYRIELFGNTACDASGHGEAETRFGAVTLTTDAEGNIAPTPMPMAAGWFVSATATDPDNNTSEFSACARSGPAASLADVAPASAQQGATLDVVLTGQNTAFLDGTTVANFGTGITVNLLTVTSATSATANISIDATAFTGGRTVTVTTGGEIVTNTFAITAGPAVLTSLTPNSATQGQSNLDVTITGQGTHFAQGVTTASFGGDITVNTIAVTSATTATVNISLDNFATTGVRSVTLTTGGENATIVNGFSVIAGTPRLMLVSPASGQQGQTLNVAVTGLFTAFVNGTTTADFGAGITVNTLTVTSATTATANVSISPLAAAGSRTVTLTSGAQSASSLDAGSFFSVAAGAASIAQVSPSSARQAENLTVTITGSNTHFANGSTVVSFGGDINVTSVLVNSPTSATVDISIPASATLGLHAVTVTTLGEVATLSNAFTVTAGLAAVSTVSPSTGRQAETLDVGVTGQLTHFVNNTTIASFGSGITVNSVTVASPTFATVNITIAPGAALGARTVTLTTGTESAQQVGGFTVTAGQPTLFSISPVAAVQGTNTTVTLNGAFTNFTPGVTTAFFGAGITVGTVTVNGPSLASVPITIAAGAQVGLRSVSVSTGSEFVTLLNAFTVLQGVAGVSGIDPNAGQLGLTRNVNITGAFTNWQSGITSVSYGAGVTVNSNVVNSPTSLTTNITIDGAATLGPRDVVVTTGTEVLTVPGGFVVTDADTTVPSLMTISPPSGATGVPLNPGITAEFNEPLDRTTLTPSTFQLYDTLTGQTLAATVSLDATGRVARLVPSQVLAVSRQYYSYLTAGITDVAGNHLGGQSYYFTTGFSTETTGPTLRLVNPQSGDTNIGRNAKITLQFDRSINSATRATGLRIQTGGVNVPGTYVLEDTQRRIRFTPATQLASSTDYTITLTTELRDIAGNALTNPGSFVFTTGAANDTTAPVVSANTPAYNDSEIGLRPEIRVAFSEPINPISVTGATFYLYNPVKNIYVKSTISLALDRRSALLTPDAPLEPSTQYYYYLASFEDLAGNVASLGVVYFRTGLVTDSTPPSVVSVDPANGATGVPVNARIRVAFSEMIDATSLSASTLQLSPAVSGALTLSGDRLALLFTPSANLAVSTTYTIQVGGVRDSSGNVMTPVSTSFSTGASSTPDTTPPTVVSFSPANGATNVSVSSPVVMTVSEPVRLVDFSAAMRVFANIVGYGQVQMPGTYSANPARTVITFTPTVQYPGATQIQAYSNYNGLTTDLAGNTLQSTVVTFTTAAAADTTAPTVVLVTPSDGATGFGPQAVVTLTFSEPLLPTTINNNTFALFAGGDELSTSISRSSDSRSVFLSSTLPFDTIITVVATSDVTDLAGNPLDDFSSSFTTGSTFDATRPQIVTQRPTGPGINGGTDVTLFVNKALDSSTVPGAFYLAQNGVLVEGALTVSGGGTAVQFDPATTLAPGALVQVFVTDAATDPFGNALYDYGGSFTVSPDPTTQPPTIVRSSPTFYSSLNPTNAVVDVEFSEPLSAATVTSANFYVVNALGQALDGTLELRSDNRVVRFRSALPFAADSYNYVYMTSGLRDLQNTPLAGTSFYFYTGAAADADAPVISSVAPPAGAVEIGVNATIRLYITEGINPLTVGSASLSLTSSAGAIPVSATFNGPNTIVTLVPQAPLPASTPLTLNMSGLEDTAGNAIAPQSVQFTTRASADTVRPSVVATNVTAYGVTNVPTNAVFTVTFDEPMDAATVLAQTSTFLYDYSTGYRAGTGSLSSDGRTYTFVPSGPLAVNRGHSINLNLGFDLSGNQMFSYSLYFTTAFAPDTTPPTVMVVNPSAGAAAVPRNAQVEVRFSEAVSTLSLGNVRLLSGGTNPVAVTRTLSDNNRLLTLRPNTLLAQNRSYTISVAGVRDTSDNLMAGTFTSTFTTGSRTDLVAPVITGANPGSEDSGVGVNMIARLTFSEPVDAVQVTSDTFRIGNAAGGAYLAAVVSVAADRRSATLTPTAPLQPYTRYYYQLSTIADVAGNAGSGTTIYFYTGAGADTTPPAIVSIAPPNAAPALPVNTRVTVMMSELIDATSVSNASIQLMPAAAGTVALGADRVTLTFIPSANLLPSTAYSVLVSGLRDTSSNTMTAASSGFTTSASSTPDTTAPAVLSRTPTNGSAGVGVSSLLTITTSERITAAAVGPGSIPVFAVLPSVGTFQLAGQYTVDSTGTLITFAVTGAFPANATIQWYTNYNSSIRDMAGLPLPNQFAQFTTANVPDTNGPTVLSVTPTNGATDVGPYATVTLTFSEAVNPNTVTATTVALFAGSTRLSPSISRSTDNRMVFLSMALPLDETITVFVTNGVTDLSGNAVLPFSSAFRTAPAFDFTRPQVITQRPSGSGVAVTSPITLFLNQPVDPSTVPGALYVAQNGILIAGTISVGWSNQAITFTPAVPYAPQATIEISLTDAARDSAGNLVNPYFGSFTTAPDPVTATPVLVRTNPGIYSSGNPTNVVVDLEFSEPLNPASVTPDRVFLRDPANQPVAGTLSLHSGNRVVRFTAADDFAPNNYNYVYFSGLTDVHGTSIASNSIYFYTGTAADTVSPSVTFVNPATGTPGVGVNGSMRITFSEPVNVTTLTADNIVVSAGGTPLATTFTIASGNQAVTVTPQLPLPAETPVTVTITGVEDVAGHAVAATSSTFTTGNAPDTTPPTVVSTSPVYGDPSVPVNSIFEWSYSEPVDVSTVLGQTSVLYDYTLGYVAGGSLSVSADARIVTYVPPSQLVAGRTYSVNLGSVADLAGNFGGGAGIYFTTSTAADLTPPQIVAANPAAGASGVPLNVRIRLAFDEPVGATSLTTVNVLVSGLPLPVASRTLSNGDRVVTLTLTSLLAPDTLHTISAIVKDRAGNAMPAFTSTFTTGTGVDLINLAGTTTPSPAGGATGVPVTVAPSITFNEAIDPTTIVYGGTSGVTLLVAATSQVVPVVYSFSADRRTVIMTPGSPLAAGTQYRIQASSVTTDLAGNVFPTTVQFLFTTLP